MIFASAMSFKVLDQLENLTRVWKGVVIELPSVSCWENLESFISWYVFSQKIFYYIIQCMILQDLVKYMKMLTISL